MNNYINNSNIAEILNTDILCIIYNEVDIKCHICHVPFTFENNFYKKVDKFYFCSKLCYEHN